MKYKGKTRVKHVPLLQTVDDIYNFEISSKISNLPFFIHIACMNSLYPATKKKKQFELTPTDLGYPIYKKNPGRKSKLVT